MTLDSTFCTRCGREAILTSTKHEILAGAAVKRFLELLEQAPRCGCGNSYETRMVLVRQLKSKDARANQLFADLFDEVL